jgi:NitT/TauT family transport system permease protein
MTALQRLNASVGLQRTLLLIVLLGLWEIYAQFFGDSVLIAAPSAVAGGLWPAVFGNPKVLAAVGLTLYELAVAFVLSVVFGILIGVGIGSTEWGRRGFMPIVLLLYAIPQVILLPLFILAFGLGPAGKIAFGFSHGIFPVLVNTVAGMQGVNQLLVRSAESMGASRAQVIRYVVFPHMVSAVFAGLRLAMTLTLLGVLLAELFVSLTGIGYFTQVYAENFNPVPLFALIFTLAIMAIALNELVRLIEYRFTRWRE